MSTLTHDLPPLLRQHLRSELLRLAQAEEATAADIAATVRYWETYPPTVSGHRACAVVLRGAAEVLDTTPGLVDPGPGPARA